MALLIGVGLGSVGLLALACGLAFPPAVGVDRSSKHGISVRNTSRLGGLDCSLLVYRLGSSNKPSDKTRL